MENPNNSACDLAAPVLHVYALSDSSIYVSWNSIPGATGYRVYRSPAKDGVYTEIGITNQIRFTDNGLPPDAIFFYKVAAFSPSQVGTLSEAVAAITFPIPIPKLVAAEALSQNAIRVTWNLTENIQDYAVFRSLREEGTYVEIATVVGAEYVDRELTAATRYFYRVAALRNDLRGDLSLSADAVTWPPAPKGLRAEAPGCDKISLTWNQIANTDEYLVYRSPFQEGPYELIGETPAPPYTDAGLQPETTYYYKAAARINGELGPLAGPAGAATTGCKLNPPPLHLRCLPCTCCRDICRRGHR